MNLSEHFTLAELTKTGTGLANIPPQAATALAQKLCQLLLEPIRAYLGSPIRITSGYRSPEVNAAVGGAATSDHCWDAEGVACDFQCSNLKGTFDWIRLESGLPFDQAILEYGKIPDSATDDCIHISYRTNPRRLAMTGQTNNRSKYQYVEVRELEGA